MERRQFLKISAGAVGSICFFPSLTSAEPRSMWLSGYKDISGVFGVISINKDLSVTPLFKTDYRLHGVSKNPKKNEIVAPSRRPGDALFIFDLDENTVLSIQASSGRHYFGHGTFSPDGRYYYAVENDFDGEQGTIGIYDVLNGYQKLNEYQSGGIGPHEVKLHPNGKSLVVANGGILTHPDTGRAKLNLDTMRPNLTILDISNGKIQEQTSLPSELHQLSIRHIDVTKDGSVLVGLQDQNKARRTVPLVWKVKDSAWTSFEEPTVGWSSFKGYIGSVTVDKGSSILCVSSPRGNIVQQWEIDSCKPLHHMIEADICGVAAHHEKNRFILTTGTGKTMSWSKGAPQIKKSPYQFDNHCVRA